MLFLTSPFISRRSSGANQVLSSLRKTFGQIRRAISADRLNRISDSEAPATPHVNHLQRAGHLLRREHASPPGTNTPSLANPVASSAVKPRLVRRRSVSPCSLTAGRLAAHRHLDTRNQLPLARLQPSEAVKCSIIERHPDGSLLVQLKRSSIDGQFGFFIAKDINGIYVSRLADVKSAAALWDVFHVGDRLVSVQGIPCTGNSEVADVRNLVANRRYVQILIRPATTCGVVTRNRSHGIKILKSPRCPQDALMR
ncbi:unnamed protein product [Protopolystoma xenopodis]|uniref:PDZ domain-containing protein n=1 Tax=Protopolystoma xenopodis TaxID=117903 RepID=A0A3S5FCF5_9PLAT|nr:unnamed protein product [Protopolystoma xenopodis]